MNIVHHSKRITVNPNYQRIAQSVWTREKLIPYQSRLCDNLMVSIVQGITLNIDITQVTCKRCIKRHQNG